PRRWHPDKARTNCTEAVSRGAHKLAHGRRPRRHMSRRRQERHQSQAQVICAACANSNGATGADLLSTHQFSTHSIRATRTSRYIRQSFEKPAECNFGGVTLAAYRGGDWIKIGALSKLQRL